jgi:hypothetical protein
VTDSKVARAEADVEQARAQLLATIGTIAAMLEPRKLVSEAWETAKDKGADLAEDAVDAVRRRPVAATGIVAALAMFLAREPIRDGIARIAGKRSAKANGKKAAPPKPPKPPAAPRKRASAKRTTRTRTETTS